MAGGRAPCKAGEHAQGKVGMGVPREGAPGRASRRVPNTTGKGPPDKVGKGMPGRAGRSMLGLAGTLDSLGHDNGPYIINIHFGLNLYWICHGLHVQF